MMFVPSEYSDYHYLVSASDNYVILTDSRTVNGSWDNPQTIDIIIQYFDPSFITIESTRSYSSSTSFNTVDISDSFYSRADSLDIIKVQVILIFMIIFFLNALTRFVKKGGVFFGS